MTTLQTELGLVKTRFPSFNSIIDLLYKNDSDFKSLCSDLFLCSKMIQDFEEEIAEKQKALAEYCDIVKDLEKELLTVINNTQNNN